MRLYKPNYEVVLKFAGPDGTERELEIPLSEQDSLNIAQLQTEEGIKSYLLELGERKGLFTNSKAAKSVNLVHQEIAGNNDDGKTSG
jgi:hypothetical protein